MFGVPVSADDSDIAHIDGGFKLLTSKDPVIKMLAWEELTETANYRQHSTRFGNMQDFLNNAPSPTSSNKYKSQWSMASDRLKIKWEIQEDRRVSLCIGDEILEDRAAVFRPIRKYLRSKHTLSLRGHPNQGKTNTCIAADRSSVHFNEGKYTTFKDWRFIHRARLGSHYQVEWLQPY